MRNNLIVIPIYLLFIVLIFIGTNYVDKKMNVRKIECAQDQGIPIELREVFRLNRVVCFKNGVEQWRIPTAH